MLGCLTPHENKNFWCELVLDAFLFITYMYVNRIKHSTNRPSSKTVKISTTDFCHTAQPVVDCQRSVRLIRLGS